MTRPRLRTAIIAFGAVAALTLTGCSSSPAPAGGTATGEPSDAPVRIAYHIDLSSMDPLRSGAGPDVPVLLTMYETLVGFDAATGETEPGIAESWEQTDTTLTFRLRDGVTFQDGTPVDAEAVKFNIERGKSDFSTQVPSLVSIDSVTVIDPLTVELALNRPDPSLPAVFADRAGMLVSPTAAAANGNDFGTAPVGAGAYELVEWREGTSITVERFEDYWDTELVTAPELEFKILTDGQAAVNALVSGQVDIVNQVPIANVETLKSSAGVTVLSESTTYVDQVYFNTSRPGLDDARVRTALNLALDRESLVAAAYLGLGAPASTYYPESHWAYTEGLDYDFDTAQAKTLLAEAGFADGFSFELVASPARTRVAEILKAQWAEIGVDVKITTKETLAAGDGYFRDGLGDALVSFWGGRLDPDQTYTQMFLTDAYYNPGAQEIPGLNAALTEAASGTTPEDRAPGFQDAAKAVFEAAPNAPLSFTNVSAAMKGNVSGYEIALVGSNKFVGVTITE